MSIFTPLVETKINLINLKKIKLNISKYSPHPKRVKIIAVTKNLSYAAIKSAENNNIFNIGENKVQETKEKTTNKKINKKTKIHLIGHLQSNKTNLAVKIYNVIESIDSLKILNKVNNSAQKIKKEQKVFLQLNISNAKTQTGFTLDKIKEAAISAEQLSNIKVIGIMSIGEHTTNTNHIKEGFIKAHNIQKNIFKTINPLCINLSMGMSQDYILALKAGSTQIRIGTALFQRKNDSYN